MVAPVAHSVTPFAARFSRRRWLVLAATAAGGGLLAACSPAAAPAQPAAATKAPAAPAPTTAAPPATQAAQAAPATSAKVLAKPATLTQTNQVTNWFAESAHGGQFAAGLNNDYQKQNLDMTTDQGGPSVSTVPLVAAGKYMFGMFSADQILLARQDGVPLVAVFAPFQIGLGGLMFHASQPVKDFSDLNGRKVYVSAASNYWQFLQKKYSLDKTQLMTYNGQLATFLADEAAVFQCYISEEPIAAAKQGVQVGYLRTADSGYNPYANIMGTTEQLIKEKPDAVQAFVTASLAGWKAYVEDPKPTLDAIKGVNKDYNVELGIQSAAIEKKHVLGPANDPRAIGSMTHERFKDIHDQLRSVGALKADLDYMAAFNASFITAAQAAAA
jgi:NitT/TauT family transport system substrate-binding protein